MKIAVLHLWDPSKVEHRGKLILTGYVRKKIQLPPEGENSQLDSEKGNGQIFFFFFSTQINLHKGK